MGVSRWSPLATAFNSLPQQRLNLNLLKEPSGLFGIDSLTTPAGFNTLKEKACIETEQIIKESLSAERKRKMVDIFDELSDTLCRVADLAEFIRVAHPRANFKQGAEDASYHISTVVEQLNTNKQLYDSLKAVVDKGDKFVTTEEDNHVAKLFLFDFEQSGIHLSDKDRKKVVSLLESAMTLGQHFIVGASKNSAIPKDRIPSSLRSHFQTEGDHVVVNSLQAESSIETVREAAFKVYLHPNEHQEYILQELLKVRREVAYICGFSSYAQRATRGTIAETPEFVAKFLDKLNKDLRPRVDQDLKMLLKVKKQENSAATAVHAWDSNYLLPKIKQQFLQMDSLDVGEFFCLGACMDGLNNLTQNIFGISLTNVEMNANESWAPDVYKLAVEHETEGLLGYIYCDFYRRPGKPDQDCHFTIRGGRLRSDGSYQNPIVVLMLNLHMPRWSGPCLLSPGQVDNLAHEMGHALHSMLGRTRHQHVAGTRCATDFAEVPSILMEYFLADPRVLRTFAKHFQTKETLPENAIQKLCQSKSLFAATETQTQVLYSVLDQRLHGDKPLEGSTSDIFESLQESYSAIPPVKNTGWQLRFSHLVGYGARYYSYLLSRSVASCIWQTYFSKDPFSRAAGEKYRQECLSHGGGKPPRLLLADFLGQEVRPELMAESLITEITQQQEARDRIFLHH